MRLRAGVRVLRRGPDEVQVGTDPRWAVRLTDLAPDEVDRLVRSGLDGCDEDSRLRYATGMLAMSGLTVPDDRLPGQAADDPAWGLLRPDDEPATRAARRASARVGVVGLGPTGLGIAAGLAAAGVGTVLVDDEGTVRPTDVGTAGYRWADVGQPREQVAARVLRDIAPGVALAGPGEVDVLVAVELGAADPQRGERLLSTGVRHLSVVVREADTVVGPLVVPGRGPCLRCLDLHRADLDPAWPVLVGQLAQAGPADGSVPSFEPGPVAAVVAGLAVAAVLTVVDGLAPTLGTTWEVGLPDAVPRIRTWRVHPRCGCDRLPDES